MSTDLLNNAPPSIRILIMDDEEGIRNSYCEILRNDENSAPNKRLDDMRARLFGGTKTLSGEEREKFELELCSGAEQGVKALKTAHENSHPYTVAFIDMRMPPGPDGVWAATKIREIDRRVDIVIVTAYSDIDPEEITRKVPPRGSLFYLQKPFHHHEIRQLAVALGRRRLAEDRIRQIAYFDDITGLPNRANFKEQLQHILDRSKQYEKKTALLFLDLDNFKRINDTLGHSTGDILLNDVSKRLLTNLRASDTIAVGNATDSENRLARLGGDEFTILLPEINSEEDAIVVAERLQNVLSKPHMLAGHEVFVTTSIGIALFPDDGNDVETLLKNADTAMYFAKREGKNQYQFYTEAMNETALRRLSVENELRKALENGELSVFYQPQLDVVTGSVSGAEALLRWNNPLLGSVAPMEFIPIAEETGLILPIGEWVLRTACSQAKKWRDEGLTLPRIAVNISVTQFAQYRFPELVKQVLIDTGLAPEVLELEITESVLLQAGMDILKDLKDLGVFLAIDDFGTGYSNLSYLKQFPIDRLKIDRAFVWNINQNPQNHAIAKAVIAMAKSLNMEVTAEGVETIEELGVLKSEECNEIQGYYISRPLSSDNAEEFLKKISMR